ncbi:MULTISPECIES: hypothetical protein [Burkholderia]|uniref:hypothetical protein n=1 Tax=Burkholderia TaxID=32008 RepID=UPI00126A1BDF|nr:MULTISPECIES: hypothetical protein [Burkholderia]
MRKGKEIYTGLYAFGDVKSNSLCGGVSAVIKIPEYSNEIMFFINNSHACEAAAIDNAMSYRFSMEELESIQRAIEKILNDVRNLKSLSRRNLLRDEAYRDPSQNEKVE